MSFGVKDQMLKIHVCAPQNGQSLSPATPPGGHLTLWAGWSGAAVYWWCITRTCRRPCSRSSASSRPFWTSLRARNGCSALTATRTATSNAQGPSTPPSTRSPTPWGRWSTPSLTRWTRHCRAGTLADFHRSTCPDDGLQLMVLSALTLPAEDCGTETLTGGPPWQRVRGQCDAIGLESGNDVESVLGRAVGEMWDALSGLWPCVAVISLKKDAFDCTGFQCRTGGGFRSDHQGFSVVLSVCFSTYIVLLAYSN